MLGEGAHTAADAENYKVVYILKLSRPWPRLHHEFCHFVSFSHLIPNYPLYSQAFP
ncbi:hypothetical protein HNQ99_000005 [Rhizorhapis suberifaciens]|uniref:Uncharacterized protein n=1 Tax=Rhizorhapis suberifaciens TaxID=13656 RepID=A0A840HPA0_9SPHN|nr:hypothetical protein [Rhizorhapis suberifaciens]